eukprot:CAMPEP_0194034814 /NCGR_PEP_ID=MMETSP0009_2-20130614/7253_1 /TAXON_ID=210454 /ORGANISM="Grammatophora oceanica, Strain CCMP 410" /LENGTH=249 /DNA_ID=CAMNT_0038675899 /DNA_START=1 /DNA_END=750 /DNA_ORIENTATION=-
MVELTAPATLEAGYTFQAIYDGVTFPVTVPEGGVKQGQTMTVPLVTPATAEITPLTALVADDVAKGHWKDGLCACCVVGCCHASLWNAMCCPQILMAQVLTRMHLNWCGEDAPEREWRMTFKRVVLLVFIFYILATLFGPPSPDISFDAKGHVVTSEPEVPAWQNAVYKSITWLFGFYTLLVMSRLRYHVRSMYLIPGSIFQDVCCVFWCGCCTVAQLARQTANYQQRRGVCCSENGLSPTTTNVAIVV